MHSEHTLRALNDFIAFADVPRLRKTLTSLILDSEHYHKNWSPQQREDYFFLYNFLEELQNPPPPL